MFVRREERVDLKKLFNFYLYLVPVFYYFLFYYFIILGHYDSEDPYPSLSDYHDYEPQLEFDDSELLEQKPEDLGDEGEWIVRTRPDLEDRDGVVYSVYCIV